MISLFANNMFLYQIYYDKILIKKEEKERERSYQRKRDNYYDIFEQIL